MNSMRHVRCLVEGEKMPRNFDVPAGSARPEGGELKRFNDSRGTFFAPSIAFEGVKPLQKLHGH